MLGIKHYAASKETRLSHGDYARMGTESHLSYAPVPPWALDDTKVRKVVAYRICITAYEPNIPTTLDGLKKIEPRYVALIGRNRSRDSQLHLEKVQRFGGPAAYYIGLIYRRFRLGMDSPALARHYGLTPTAIRQTINRLCRIARSLFPNAEDHLEWHHTASVRNLPRLRLTSRTFSYEKAYELWLSGLDLAAISEQLGVKEHSIYDAVRKMRAKEVRLSNRKIDIALARRLRNQGHTLQEIAATCGLKSRTGVMQALRRAENRNAA